MDSCQRPICTYKWIQQLFMGTDQVPDKLLYCNPISTDGPFGCKLEEGCPQLKLQEKIVVLEKQLRESNELLFEKMKDGVG